MPMHDLAVHNVTVGISLLPLVLLMMASDLLLMMASDYSYAIVLNR